MFDFGFGGSGLFRFLFRSFRWFRWFRSGCSGGFVPVVPGFSTCLLYLLKNTMSDHETDSEESYQTDDSDINFIPGYIMNALTLEVRMMARALKRTTRA